MLNERKFSDFGIISTIILIVIVAIIGAIFLLGALSATLWIVNWLPKAFGFAGIIVMAFIVWYLLCEKG